MTNKQYIQFFLLLFIFSGTVFAQEKQMKKGTENFENLAFIDAISIYEKVANKGYISADLFQKLGDAYYFNAEYQKANNWYEKLINLNDKNTSTEYYFRYAQTLKSLEKYNESDAVFKIFAEKSLEDNRAGKFLKNEAYIDFIKSNSNRFEIAGSGINTAAADYGSSYYGNKIVFASTRDTGGIFKRQLKWTNDSFSDLYIADIDEDGILTNPVKFSKNINTKFNESTPVFTKDGKTMYFTRNDFYNKKLGKNTKDVTLLKIFRAKLKDSIWTDVIELPFNSSQYSVAHPALSNDEKWLFFASDMPGTIGESDIFKCEIFEDGTFGTPINLGPQINTKARETFPFIDQNDNLYFASEGHMGLGGLDVFFAQYKKDETYAEPVNIGEPINSPTDDFAFVINTETKTGYFSSYRNTGKGFDDIYKFKELIPLRCDQVLSGIISDVETNEILADVEVSLVNSNNEILKTTKSDPKGFYTFEVSCDAIYFVKTSYTGYQPTEKQATIPEISGRTELDIKLEKIPAPIPVEKPFEIGEDIAKTLKINKIYFDLGKWNIRPDAAVELAKILEVMLEYPTLVIDVRSHTDSRDSHKNNERLSDRRAKSTVSWFIEKGIDPGRISGKGYGETQLINKCADGVKCTEEEHQLNRRSEFIVISI